MATRGRLGVEEERGATPVTAMLCRIRVSRSSALISPANERGGRIMVGRKTDTGTPQWATRSRISSSSAHLVEE